MKHKFLLPFTIVLVTIAVFSLVYLPNRVISQPPTGPIETEEEAIARITSHFASMTQTSEEPVDPSQIEVLEARLLRYEDTFKIVDGGKANYDPDLPYTPDSLVWVTMVASPLAENLPMFAQGPLEYAGATFVSDAVTGRVMGMISFSDFENDEMIQQLLELESLEGQVEVPVEAADAETERNLFQKIFLPLFSE